VRIALLAASWSRQFLVALYKAFCDYQKLNLHSKKLQKSTCQTPSRTKLRGIKIFDKACQMGYDLSLGQIITHE
jgi:hypothetical protein